MKKFLKIVKENNELKEFNCVYEITIYDVIESTDITNAGEEAQSRIDEIESHLDDLHYNVGGTVLQNIDEADYSDLNEQYGNDETLNKTTEEEIEMDVVDIFNVVEKRINKLDVKSREIVFEMLKYKMNKITEWSEEKSEPVTNSEEENIDDTEDF